MSGTKDATTGDADRVKCLGCWEYWPTRILDHVGGCPGCGPDPRTAHVVRIDAVAVVHDPQPTRRDIYETARDQLRAVDGFHVERVCVTDIPNQRAEFTAHVPVEHRERATEGVYVDTARQRVMQTDTVISFSTGEVVS